MPDDLIDYHFAMSIAFADDMDEFDRKRRSAHAVRRQPVGPSEVPKGTCPKCGKIFRRGLHFHVKACRGSDG